MKLIGIRIIGNSKYIGTSLSGSVQEVKLKGKVPIQFIPKNITKGDRMSHWVGHSDPR